MPTGIETDPSQLFLSFSEPECRTEFLCGGKGASLGILHFLAQQKTQSRYQKFTIPNGFVLTINAFKLQLGRCEELQAALRIVGDVAASRLDGDLETVCKHAYELFKDAAIEPEIVQAVLSIYDVLQENYINQGNNGGDRHPFRVAVRSSAIGEDSVEASAAGQNDTFLGCHTTADVLAAVKYCWASLYSYQSVFYRKQNLQPICTQMAVVIQTMVPAECAGVLFTRHPVDNDAYKLLISANYGLGEVSLLMVVAIILLKYLRLSVLFISQSFPAKWIQIIIQFAGVTNAISFTYPKSILAKRHPRFTWARRMVILMLHQHSK